MLTRLFSACFIVAIMVAFPPFTLTAYAQSADPLVVEADDSLEWRREDRQYIATGNAVATQGETTLKADVITADYRDDAVNEAENVNITRIIGAGAAMLSETTFNAAAEKITYDLASNIATLEGGSVSVTADDGTITARDVIIYRRGERLLIARGSAEINLSNGQQLSGDVIEVDLNADETDFIAVRAKGNAEVFSPGADGSQEARAENIDYTRETGIAVLEGDVEILDGSNVMTGDMARINTISGISTMTSTGGRVGGVFKP